MTEITKFDENTRPRELPPAIEHFVLQWGDLGGKWGVNRSVAQIHALLYLSDRPLTAEDIADRLGLARSNVSNSIKELQAWNLIRRVPIKGDRRDHFEAETDVWEIFARIATGRKEREIDPAIAALRACAAEADGDPTHATRWRIARLKAHARIRRHHGPLVRPDGACRARRSRRWCGSAPRSSSFLTFGRARMSGRRRLSRVAMEWTDGTGEHERSRSTCGTWSCPARATRSATSASAR